ncbi:MAG: class I SAM-dependent methyltransferase [Anaerolineales bacterium]|jgi:SAM-dependent methyltransferase
MRDDVSDISDFYNRDPDREHERLERHQLEYDLTWRYLDKYLPAEGSILEIGTATGRYTLELAKRGYLVTAVDLSPEMLEECKQKTMEEGLERQVQFVLADARDLGAVEEEIFDAVLLMGPLYHLIFKGDRKLALKQARDRLRSDGVLFSAFISRYGIMGDLMRNNPGWIEDQKEVQSVLAKGRQPDDYPRSGFRGYLAKPAEIVPLHEAVGFETLILAGVEPAISADDESYNQLQGEQRKRWLDLLYEISTAASLLGASRHILYIGRKK